MFKGRGRGKLPHWPKSPSPSKYAVDGDICVGRQRKLSIVRSITKGRGVSINVLVIQLDDSEEKVENGKLRKSLAPKCTRLLFEGLFVDTSHVTSLSDFPERILKKIFAKIGDVKTLASCERVCRRWKSLLSNPDINPLYDSNVKVKQIRARRVNFVINNKITSIEWHGERGRTIMEGDYASIFWQLPAHYGSRQCLLNFIKSIFVKCRVTSGLAFEKFDIWKDLLKLVVEYQKQIANLRFLRCYIHNDALVELNPLKQLRNFAVDQCNCVSDAISPRIILTLVKSNNINNLELCGLRQLIKIDDTVFDAIFEMWKYRKISFLKLANCPNVTTDAIVKLVEKHRSSHDGQLVIFLENTGFNTDTFLIQQRCLKIDKSASTSRRLLLKGSGPILIWVEI